MDTASIPARGAIIERLAFITGQCGEGLEPGEVLSRTYCEFMPGRSREQGDLMAGVILDTAGEFYSWYELAGDDPKAFSSKYLSSLAAACAPEAGQETLARFKDILSELDGMPGFPDLTEEDAAALAVLDRRSGELNRSAWEAVTLYTAGFEGPRGLRTALGQLTAASCGQQAGLSTACALRQRALTSDRAWQRLNAAQMVTAAMLAGAAVSGGAFQMLFAGSLALAVSACREALSLASALTAGINRIAAVMFEKTDVHACPLNPVLSRHGAAESISAQAAGAFDGDLEQTEEHQDEQETQPDFD